MYSLKFFYITDYFLPMKMSVSEDNLRSLRVREKIHVQHVFESNKRVPCRTVRTPLETGESHGQVELLPLSIYTENPALQQRLMDSGNYTPEDSQSHPIFNEGPRSHHTPATMRPNKCNHSPSNFPLQDPVSSSKYSFYGRTQTTPFHMVQFLFVSFLLLSTVCARDIHYPSTSLIKSWRLQKLDDSLSSAVESLTETPKAKELERVARSAQTPPSKQEKTTAKRDISPFITNSHHKPQRLATKLGYYVEIKKNGKVKGSRRQTAYSKHFYA